MILSLARVFNTPVDVWWDMELPKLFMWVMVADQMLAEEEAKRNVQKIGPGI